MRSIQEGRFCQGGKQKVNGEWAEMTDQGVTSVSQSR